MALAGGHGAVHDVRVRPPHQCPGAQEKFDAAAFGEDNYSTKVKPAIEEYPVDLASSSPLLQQDAEAAGEQYGTREGTSPYTYSVTADRHRRQGRGRPPAGHGPGRPAVDTRVSVQVGPAINGTALRDASGLVSFNDFVNQVEYADAATALNTEMKADLLKELDPRPWRARRSPWSARPHRSTRRSSPSPRSASRWRREHRQPAHAGAAVLAARERHQDLRRHPRPARRQPDVAPGRVTALFGENGAGKSTLMKILAGIETPTTGQVELDGEVVEFASPRQAADHGVVIIHQELSLCPNLSIQDNLFLARERHGRLGQRRPRATQRAASAEVLERLEEHLDPDTLVGDLRIGQQQLVEIARALLQNARVLIMDEPTSALSMTEVDVLFRVIRELTARRGGGRLHLPPPRGVPGDRRRRRRPARRPARRDRRPPPTSTSAGWSSTWSGRDQDSLFPKRPRHLGEWSLVGRAPAGRRPLQPAAAGRGRHRPGDARRRDRRRLRADGLGTHRAARGDRRSAARHRRATITLRRRRRCERESVRERIRRGIALVPEDRQRDGLVQTMSVGQNLSLSSLMSFVRRGLVARSRERDAVADDDHGRHGQDRRAVGARSAR